MMPACRQLCRRCRTCISDTDQISGLKNSSANRGRPALIASGDRIPTYGRCAELPSITDDLWSITRKEPFIFFFRNHASAQSGIAANITFIQTAVNSTNPKYGGTSTGLANELHSVFKIWRSES